MRKTGATGIFPKAANPQGEVFTTVSVRSSQSCEEPGIFFSDLRNCCAWTSEIRLYHWHVDCGIVL